MRIAIDCRLMFDPKKNNGAGIERYVFYLVENLLRLDRRTEFVLLVKKNYDQETLRAWRKNYNVKIIYCGRACWLFTPHVWLAVRLLVLRPNVCLFPSYVMPLLYFGPSLLIVHDVAIYAHPEWFPDRQWLAVKILVPWSLFKARKIATISQTTKNDLLAKFKKLSASKIQVIYPGITKPRAYNPEYNQQLLSRLGVKNKFLLFLGTIEPRKNIAILVQAFQKAVKNNTGWDLILAGAAGWKHEKIFAQIKKTNLELGRTAVKYLGAVAEAEKAALYQECRAFVFPSLYEGFGLPVFEAMSYGAPVIATDNSALREVIQQQALKVNPLSRLDIKNAIQKIINDEGLRFKLGNAGPELANRFSWPHAAEQVLASLKSITNPK